jgi:hypothetical protein
MLDIFPWEEALKLGDWGGRELVPSATFALKYGDRGSWALILCYSKVVKSGDLGGRTIIPFLFSALKIGDR